MPKDNDESQNQEMPCPRCKTMHKRGPYVDQKRVDKTVCAPLDVDCPCGAKLKMVVPVFKVDRYGWHWRIV